MDSFNDKSAQPMSANLYTELQAAILSGEFPNLHKLTEQAICKKYNVSRTPVREALRQLEADGLIENIPNRGAYVTALSKRDISDLFDLRSLFEIQAIEWAIKRMSSEDIDDLRETLEFMEFYTLKNPDVQHSISQHTLLGNQGPHDTKNAVHLSDISQALGSCKNIFR